MEGRVQAKQFALYPLKLPETLPVLIILLYSAFFNAFKTAHFYFCCLKATSFNFIHKKEHTTSVYCG
jgi:hypothetical protein